MRCVFPLITIEIVYTVIGYPGYVRSNAIGRVYTVQPTQRECFYLLMLLFKVRGPTSFIDLRTLNGLIHSIYHQACEARAMLEHDNQWTETMNDSNCHKSCHVTKEERKDLVLKYLAYTEDTGSQSVW